MNKVLLVDDNEEIQAANADYLTRKGYEVDIAYNSKEALIFLEKKTFDCIVLDIMMPDLDGFNFCSMVRKHYETPIIFLSCLDGEDERVRGLLVGGDDYMTKPYSVKELAARIYSQIRRDKVLARTKMSVKNPLPNVLSDSENRKITISGTTLILSKKEYDILSYLVSKPNELVTKKQLVKMISGEENSVGVYIMRIRSKLSAGRELGTIENVFGEGYMYKPMGDKGL